MSRRRGEFEHRTSIFEGAFRAWSHLGGLEPEELESKPASDLDPLTNPIENDNRLSGSKAKKGEEVPRNPDGSKRREYPYEPLPRSGLAHPYVQAILSPWLGPDADNEAIQLGLTTLRTWWQHRRKGESGSAIAALGTEKMKGVVEGYTRHFFTLAHCLIMNDKEQPPRSLHTKMKELDKIRNKRNKKRAREDEDSKLTAMALNGGFGPGGGPSTEQAQLAAGINADLTDTTLSPLERLHAAQRRQLAESGGIHSTLPGVAGSGTDMSALPPVVNMKGKCFPGKIDLPGVVDAVSHQAAQLSHRGVSAGGGGAFPNQVPSSGGGGSAQYGDPTTTPVVFVSQKGDIQIAMTVDGITCAHCVKIVETVLKGCNGNKSPIDGLLDAAADRVLHSVLIKIDKSSSAKRIAFEAARNLAMVGYTAKAKEMSIVGQGADKKATMDLGALSTAFEVVASGDIKDVFDWGIPCTCPDNGILRDDCARYEFLCLFFFSFFSDVPA
jgi:copper chaperone CopZ